MAVSNKNYIDSLIQGYQLSDPKLYEILIHFSENFGSLLEDIAPLLAPKVTIVTSPPNPVLGVTYELDPSGVRIRWTPPADENNVALYDIRKGNDWATAERMTKTPNREAYFNPLPVGTTRFLVKTIGQTGLESVDYLYVDVEIPQVGYVSITSKVIDNNVLLSWTVPDSVFRIDHYRITRNGVDFLTVAATFATIFESSSAQYWYGVIPVDIAGNEGVETRIPAEVKQPADYVLQATHNSDFSGTKSSCFLDEHNRLVACVSTTETWETHFSSRGYNTIQDQISAGFPYFLEPGQLAGYYEEVVDFGAIFNNVIVNLAWDTIEIDAGVTITGQIEVSDDGSTYSAPVAGTSLFARSMRYARVRLVFTGQLDALIAVTKFQTLLDVKQETDSGSIDALAADATGTQVTFNKSFKDVNSITLTVNSVEPIYTVYDFQDIANPTGFKVFAFDSAGNRVDYKVSWKARGVV